MEIQAEDAVLSGPRIRATLRLGSESFTVISKEGVISEQLVSMKEETVSILKDFITKHNIPNEVPDEPLEGSSEDEEIVEKPPKSKKQK